MKNIEFQLEELTCPSCIKKIERTLSKVDGVASVRVLFNSSKVRVSAREDKTPQELAGVIENLGYSVLSQKLRENKVEA